MTHSYKMDMEMEQDPVKSNGKYRSSSGGSRSKVGVCLAVIALLISLVAFILAVILLSDPQLVPSIKDNYPSDGAKAEGETSGAEKEAKVEPEGNKMVAYSGSPNSPEDKTYVFALLNNYPPWTFTTARGRSDGFYLDIFNVLCRRANKRCRYAIFDSLKVIWDSELDTSAGLNRHYFDGGMAFHTPPRAAAYTFSEPVFKRSLQGGLYQMPGQNYTEQDAKTLKVGFRSGFFTSAACLRRELGGELKDENVVLFNTDSEIVDALKDGTIQLIFSVPTPGLAALHSVKTYTSCSNGNIGMMARKDSPMLGWFNTHLKKMKEDGTLKQICDNAVTKYGLVSHDCAL